MRRFLKKLPIVLVLILLVSLGMAVSASAASSGARNPGTAADSGLVGTKTWTDVDRMKVPGGTPASVSLAKSAISHYLVGTNYGFTIPADSHILGISVTINRMANNASTFRDSRVVLFKAGVPASGGSNYAKTSAADSWPTSLGPVTYGGTNDLWGSTWTPADINDAGFGVALSATNYLTTGGDKNANVDYMQITVTYSPAVTLTPVGGNVVANTLNSTNTALTASANIVAGQATSAELLINGASFATPIKVTSIGATDTRVTFTTNTTTTSALQAKITSGGTISVKLTDSAGNSSVSTVDNPTLTVDYIAPVITINPYTTTPTNQNITVTASTNEGTLNATSHTFTANGSFTFTATDTAGNTSSRTVTITNIDKTAPVITINPYTTTPTNQNITVTASTNEGTLNATSHTFTANDSFTFTATDAVGNSSSQTVTITNIDKTAPTIAIGSPSATTTNSGPVTYNVTFADSPTTGSLTAGNITLNKTGTADGTVSVLPGGSLSTGYTVQISSITGDGTLGISVAAGIVSDVAGNASAATGPSATFNVANPFTVTFDANGGGTPSPTSKSVTNGSAYGALASVSRTDYNFDGWFTDDGTKVNPADIVNLTGPQTLYAHWTLIPTRPTVSLSADVIYYYDTTFKDSRISMYFLGSFTFVADHGYTFVSEGFVATKDGTLNNDNDLIYSLKNSDFPTTSNSDVITLQQTTYESNLYGVINTYLNRNWYVRSFYNCPQYDN